MVVRIAVCVKQVVDPDTPATAFVVDENAKRVKAPQGAAPVVNGFDLNAVEAALRIKESSEAEVQVTIISVGFSFVMDVIKKPLSMGADELILVEDKSLVDIDGVASARVLAAALRLNGPFDLIFCGRQASDWDQSYVPMGIAEILKIPCVSYARRIELVEETVRIERTLTDGYQTVEAPTPIVITVSNELGETRYPTLRGIMSASRTMPAKLSLSELAINPGELAPSLSLRHLFVPNRTKECEMITGDDDEDAGRRLAIRLREEALI